MLRESWIHWGYGLNFMPFLPSGRPGMWFMSYRTGTFRRAAHAVSSQ
ncbi:hypothetical protein BIFDEN_02255 [Bifidobacterium dentium ATCC 27678]|nr:hypothetical protein BIFDEN_02255 [Bifidobacterium dentium ATCC 27678]